MSNSWIDILTGLTPNLNQPVLHGQWMLTSPDTTFRINGLEVRERDRLVAQKNHVWSYGKSGGSSVSESFAQKTLPNKTDTDVLLQMNGLFETTYQSANTYKGWAAHSPLTPSLQDHIKITSFDKILENKIIFLEEVCKHPRTHLRMDTDLQPVARARRIARQAIVRLASHREDWDRPTVLGVRPKRILCLVPEEEYDLYENRVAVTLVNKMRSYLLDRLSKLHNILRMVNQVDHSKEAASDHIWRRNRLYALWGGVLNDKSVEQLAYTTQKRLDALYKRVLALLDSVLYRSVPKTIPVTALRFTNIFTNDINYRQIALLWKHWDKLNLARPLSEANYYQNHQKICNGMSGFARVLVTKALTQLHLNPINLPGVIKTKHMDFELIHGPLGDCQIVLDSKAGVVLTTSCSRIRIVGIPSAIAAETSEDFITLRKKIESSISTLKEDHVLLLHLPANRSHDSTEPLAMADNRLPLKATSWKPPIDKSLKLSLLEVSPWDLASVERLARFLRWHLYAPKFLEYPPQLKLPIPKGFTNIDWLLVGQARDERILLRKPTIRESSIISLMKAIYDATFKDLSMRGGKGIQNARRNTDAKVKEYNKILELNLASINLLCICPVCNRANNELKPLDMFGKSFEVNCPGCNAAWGIYACGEKNIAGNTCNNRVPFIMPMHTEFFMQHGELNKDEWVDSILGADILIIPCLENNKLKWRCNNCSK